MIYENIKELCDKKKISIRNLERKTGLGNGTIGKWRKPDSNPSVYKVLNVANELGVSVERLVKG